MLRLYDLAGTAKFEFKVHKSYAVPSVAFSPDGARIATASTDNTALLIDIATGKVLRTFNLEPAGGRNRHVLAMQSPGHIERSGPARVQRGDRRGPEARR